VNPWWLVLAGALGLLAGALANFCAERWSRHAPRISPWNAKQSSLLGRAPVLGWWMRRKEIDAIARWRWLRAAMVEVALAALFVYLAWAPAQSAFLRPLVLWGNEVAPQGFPLGVVWHPADGAWLLAQFASRAALMFLMAVASLIDFEEKIIPDEVTVPGTYLGWLLAALWPLSTPVGLAQNPAGADQVTLLTLTFPIDWPAWLQGAPRAGSLALALGCFALWYFALWPWLLRRGRSFTRGLELTIGWLRKRGNRWVTWILPLATVALIAFTWWHGGERWTALLTSLFGAAFGVAFTWCMRTIASHVLAEEALGFGDVTLMAMIGAFLGWQVCLMAFFFSGLLALVIGLARLAILGDRAIYLGPFICLAAGWIALRWPIWWERAAPAFGVPWLVPAALVTCLGLMWVLLIGVRAVKEFLLRMFGIEEE
jgi:leader peptidase (prepilin peptidase)/N-methyltransferase